MIIDLHTHTFPEKIAARAVQSLSEKSGSRAFAGGTDEDLCISMREAGIDRSVVLPVATNPEKIGHMNDVTIAKNGKNGLFFFGAVHPDAEDSLSQLERLARAGIRGVKIHPVYQGTDLDDPRFLRILSRAGELDLCVVTHAGDDIGFPGETQASPEKIARALREVGNVKFILAHMGGWKNWERVADALAHSSAMLDTSFSLGQIPLLKEDAPEEEKRLLTEAEFCSLVRAFGAERIFFGTDSPWTGQRESLEAIRALPLTEKEKTMILGENARALLGI